MLISNVRRANAAIATRFRTFFAPRDFIFRDGAATRRIRIGIPAQVAATGAAALTLGLSAYGAGHAAGFVATQDNGAQIAQMERQVARMEADVAGLRTTARAHAARIEHRQSLLAAVMTGEGDPAQLAATAFDPVDQSRYASIVTRPYATAEARQIAFAAQATAMTDARYDATRRQLRSMGLRADRLMNGMGGPFEPVEANPNVTPAASTAATDIDSDAQFRALFLSWKKMDTLEQAVIAIPSLQPVADMRLTSSFGVRSDPFRGTAAMHAGIDIPGPTGTPIYATADGIIGRAERAGGYGNLITINHGKGIETRYGHLSKILVSSNTRVKRGQLIGLMGSTGRSTGPHLHYEVRIDGAAVNPMPYMQSAELVPPPGANGPAMGGPRD